MKQIIKLIKTYKYVSIQFEKNMANYKIGFWKTKLQQCTTLF